MGIDFDWLENKILLRKLDAEERSALEELLQVATYEKGGRIVSEGSGGGTLFFLREGVAEITRNTGNGDPIRITTAREGALFGEMSFVTGGDHSADVTAMEDCTVYKLSRAAFSALMQKHQDIVYGLISYMLVHAANVIRRMNEEHIALQHYIMGGRV